VATFQNTSTKKAFIDNASSKDTYIIDSTVKVFSLGGLSNGDTFAFDGFSSDYQFSYKSGILSITNPDIAGYKVTIKLASTDGAVANLKFVDGDLTALVSKVGSKAATLSVGGQSVTSKAAVLSDAVVSAVTGNGSVPIIDAASGQTGTTVVSGTPTYALASSATSVAEGSTVIYTLSTTNVAAGSVLGYTLTGTGSAAGLTNVGTFTVDSSGKSAVAITVPANATTGDTGTIVLKLNNGSATAGSVAVTDTTVASPQTFVLTTGIDQFTGSSTNDVFNATSTSGINTLSEADSLVGGNGTDTLNAQLSYSVTPQLSGIEVVSITSTTSTSAITFDFQSTSGVTQVFSNGVQGALSLNNITSPSTTVTIGGTSVNHTVDYLNSAVTGSADKALITLSNVTAGTLTVDSGIETVALTALGTDTVTLVASATAITVGGSGSITLAGTTAATSIDASSNSGGVVISSASASASTVAGGSGNDSLTGSSAADSLVGGAGNDTIIGNGGADSINGGANNDTFVFASEANLTGAGTVIGGDGSGDIISLTASGTYTDAIFTKVTGVEILSLANTVAGSGVVLGTLALADGLTSVAGSTHNDSITLSAAFTALTVNGGSNTGSDSVVVSATTSAEVITVLQVAAVTSSSGSDTITVGTANTTNVTILAGAGNDTITLGGTGTYSAVVDGADGNDSVVLSSTFTGGFAVSVTNVETLTGSSVADTITLTGTVGTVVDAGAGSDTITVAASSTSAYSLSGGAGNDTFVFADTQSLTSVASVIGGDGAGDILSLTASGAYTDAIFTKVTGVEILNLASTVAGSTVVLGTLALADGLTSVAGSTHNDSITLSAAFTALTIDGGANTGSDVVTFAATGGETVSVLNIAQVTVSSTVTAAEALTVLSTAAGTITVDLGAGTDTVVLGNTFTYTISASNVETITGNAGNDVVVGTTGIGTFDGGAGSDTYTFAAADLTITVANVEGITGIAGTSETVTLLSANSSTISMTNVNNIVGSTGNDLVSDTVSASVNENFVISGGSGDDTLILSITQTGTLTSSVSVFGGAGNDTVTVTDSYTAGAYVHFLNGGAGADTITGTTGVDVVQISIANDLQATTTFSLADYVVGAASGSAGFNTAGDYIDLSGGSLTSANGTTLNVLASTGSNGTASNNATFTSATASTAADFADLTTTYQSTNLFFINDTITGSFVTQASIDAAVTVLTGKVATGDTTVGTKVVFVFNDGDSANSAIFQYTEAGTTGIQASEVKLVAVVVGHGDLSSTNFV